jgi:hypothetical protein
MGKMGKEGKRKLQKAKGKNVVTPIPSDAIF